jgi:hypothetical protein
VYTLGTIFLGTPLGDPSFIAWHLNDKATKYDECCRSMQCQLDDLQTKTSLFCNCLQGTIPHLLAADIALHSPSAIHPIDPYAWSSPFLLCLNAMTSNFLLHISSHPVSQFHPSNPQWTIAYALISMGSLGFQDYTTHAVASFILLLAWSIHYATTSVHPKHSENTCLHMDPLLSQGLLKWQTSPPRSLPCCFPSTDTQPTWATTI